MHLLCAFYNNFIRQGGLLSPYLFRYYIHNTIGLVTKLNIKYFGMHYNLIAYADDMVLLAPSWSGLQSILVITESQLMNLVCLLILRNQYAQFFIPSTVIKLFGNNGPYKINSIN